MKRIAALTALIAGIVVTLGASAQAPQNITVSWHAVTEYVDNTPIASPVTYTLYAAGCSSCPCASDVTWTAIATGLTTTSSLRAAVTPTVHGYTVTATAGGVESDKGVPACVDASVSLAPAAPKKPQAPGGIAITPAT